MTGKHAIVLAAVLVALTASAAVLWLGWRPNKPVLVVFHAGSLTVPFKELAKRFEAAYGVEVHLEAYGSVDAIRQIIEHGRSCDVLAVADYKLIPQLMWPDYAGWCLIFATNEIVIAYTDNSLYADEIGPDNWPDVLCREGVRIGRADPARDPCGYRTLLVWKLAEAYYGLDGLYERLMAKCPQPTRPKSHDLVALLQMGQLDYAFLYKSVAVQHDLKFVDLPPEIDLGHEEYANFYASASVEATGLGEVKGEPIRYAITIPKVAEKPDLALKFVEFLLSEEGTDVLTSCGQNAVRPALALGYDNLPEDLKPYAVRWERGT